MKVLPIIVGIIAGTTVGMVVGLLIICVNHDYEIEHIKKNVELIKVILKEKENNDAQSKI